MGKKVTIIGFIGYCLLLALSIYYYKERSVFLDSSFHLFYMLKDRDFVIQNSRFGCIITQLMPLIGSKLDASLALIMKLYSSSFVVINLIYFLIITLVFKQYKFGICLLLLNTFIVTHSFYWPLSEYTQGISIAIFYFAMISTKKYNLLKLNSLKSIILHVSFSIILVFIYPLMLFPFLFALIYFCMIDLFKQKLLIQIALLFVSVLILKTLFFNTGYEASSMGGIKNFITLFPNYFTNESNINFFKNVVKVYYMLPIGLIVLGVFYYKKTIFKRFLFVLACFFGYLLLINVSYPKDVEVFYIENLYTPLGLIVFLPLVFEVSPKLSSFSISISYSIIIAIGLLRIHSIHQPYSERINWMSDTIEYSESLNNKKIMIDETIIEKDLIKMSWASAYEFWLLSTSENDKTSSIIIDDQLDKLQWTLEHNTSFITKWGVFKYEEMPKKYFKLNDTSYYQVIREPNNFLKK